MSGLEGRLDTMLRAAVDALTSTEQAAQAQYIRHVKIARVAFEGDRGTLQALHLLGRRKATLAGWRRRSSSTPWRWPT